MFAGLSPMNPLDENVPFVADFSNVLGASETIASVVGVTALPETIAASDGTVIDGVRAGCAVQFTLGNGADGYTYAVTVEIESTAGITLARTLAVAVQSTV